MFSPCRSYLLDTLYKMLGDGTGRQTRERGQRAKIMNARRMMVCSLEQTPRDAIVIHRFLPLFWWTRVLCSRSGRRTARLIVIIPITWQKQDENNDLQYCVVWSETFLCFCFLSHYVTRKMNLGRFPPSCILPTNVFTLYN